MFKNHKYNNCKRQPAALKIILHCGKIRKGIRHQNLYVTAITTEKAARCSSMVSSLVFSANSDTANCNASVRLSAFADAFILMKTRKIKTDKYDKINPKIELDPEDLVGIA